MARGRRRIPVEIQIARNNPGKRALPTGAPEFDRENNCPDWLTESAKEEWNDIAPRLEKARVLTDGDHIALAQLCEYIAEWKHARKMVDSQGMVTTTPNGLWAQNPFMVIASKRAEQIQRLLIEFGMTPASRTKVRAIPKDMKDKTKQDKANIDDFFGD